MLDIENADARPSNPLLAKLKMPGRIFSLPSKGIPYSSNEISDEAKRINGEIQIHPMTTLDEIKMKSADLLYSGKAIEEVLLSCVSSINKPLDLSQQDIDAILCFLRISTYGPIMSVQSQHTCRNSKLHSYEVDLEKVVIEGEHRELTPEIWELMYTLTLPNGQVVKLKPVSFRDVISVIHTQQVAEEVEASGKPIDTTNLSKEMFLKNMAAVIKQVDDITDPLSIREWLEQIQPTYARKISAAAAAANAWGLDLKPKIKCRDCGAEYEYELPLNPVSFFSE